jgi:putative transposase
MKDMALVRTWHNIYDTHYHIVFPVKYRKALLTDDLPLAIVSIAQEISARYDITFEKIGCDRDHLHILASFPPKYSGSAVVRIFKSITAKQLFLRFPALRKELWGGEFWSDGFYIATVSERGNWKAVEQYVANQGKTMGESSQLRLFT